MSQFAGSMGVVNLVMRSEADEGGHFGKFGGRYVPETLIAALDELAKAYEAAKRSPEFRDRLDVLLGSYAGRPTPLYLAESLGKVVGGPRIYLKREDLAHTGAHKINNVLGQALLAKSMGKERVIAETGAGQHGVAIATACALLDLSCEVYMGAEDVVRQALNVFRMELLGAQVHSVTSGSKTLKDAINEAMRDWVTNIRTTYYCIGSVMGPAPYPTMVRDFQRVIGVESKEQILRLEERLPDLLVACVGGGSNAIGLFHPFIECKDVRMVGVEPGGEGIASGFHGATLATGSPGIFHGQRTFVLSDASGQILPAHSVSAGLDYPGVGPEHAFLKDTGRVKYEVATDAEALEAFQVLSKTEGILPALESAHAIAYLLREGGKMSRDELIIVNLSGRGDKDVSQVRKILEKPSEALKN